jgi:hypothetical protein
VDVSGDENVVDPDTVRGCLAMEAAGDGGLETQGFVDDGVEVGDGFDGIVGPGGVAGGEEGVEEGLQVGVGLGVFDEVVDGVGEGCGGCVAGGLV